MDVRARTAILFGRWSLNFSLRFGGFDPRHSIVILLLYAVPPNDEDRYVEKICEKLVELFGGLIKNCLPRQAIKICKFNFEKNNSFFPH
jgi:hypothetical protein